MNCRMFLTCAVVGCLSTHAHASYILTAQSDGMSSATVEWGDSLTLDLVLTSNAADVHNSAIFQMTFTEAGLMYESYSWLDPYVDGPPYDDSTPGLESLPVILDADTLTGPGFPSGVVDIELSNVLVGPTFGEGTLVSLLLSVPEDYGFTGSIFIAASPDTFANGFDEIPTAGGQVFEAIVIPEPSTCAVLLVTLAASCYRRRRSTIR